MLPQELGARRYLGSEEQVSHQGWLRRGLISACPLSGGMQPQVGMPGAGPVPLERGQGKTDVCSAVCGVSLAPVSSAVSQLSEACLCPAPGLCPVCSLRHKAVVAAPWLPGLSPDWLPAHSARGCAVVPWQPVELPVPTERDVSVFSTSASPCLSLCLCGQAELAPLWSLSCSFAAWVLGSSWCGPVLPRRAQQREPGLRLA